MSELTERVEKLNIELFAVLEGAGIDAVIAMVVKRKAPEP
jgi:hypothetical protein